MFKFAIACLSAVASAHLAGGTEFKTLGRVDFKLASYIQFGKFGDEDLLLAAEFAGQPWKGGSVALVKGVKDGVINGDVGNLEAVELDTSPYDL